MSVRRKEMTKQNNWRNDPVTDKQRELIHDMRTHSDWPLPAFTGTTKGEASDYIDRWIAKAHETILDCWDVTQGIP